ncbi:hypothetical protein GOBAR_AA18021 [Gossypium barbadense]|uniref:Uncharacterized protein n=1 Tax=Gossypium barbadense TaxID=3634 RepID=A0A2P5XH00_GOSBA|nr:hypothetical protein GOBAR_AA18021 [Gossypium barbadense]
MVLTTFIDVGAGELVLRLGDKTITFEAHDSVRTSSDRDGFKSSVNFSDHVALPSLQENPRKKVIEPYSSQCNRHRTIYDERLLQLHELDEWRTQVKEKLKKHDEKPKRLHDEHVDGTNQFKVGDKVLLDKTDPRIATLEIDTNGSNPFTVLTIFPYGIVKLLLVQVPYQSPHRRRRTSSSPVRPPPLPFLPNRPSTTPITLPNELSLIHLSPTVVPFAPHLLQPLSLSHSLIETSPQPLTSLSNHAHHPHI